MGSITLNQPTPAAALARLCSDRPGPVVIPFPVRHTDDSGLCTVASCCPCNTPCSWGTKLLHTEPTGRWPSYGKPSDAPVWPLPVAKPAEAPPKPATPAREG